MNRTMTQEDKELSLKDLCARLPYGVKVMKQFKSQVRTLKSIDVENYYVYFVENDVNSPFGFSIENPLKFHQQIKPYLRPMSSMTEEEKEEYWNIINLKSPEMPVGEIPSIETIAQCSVIVLDWLLSKGFDIRGLIPMGLALEAPEGMYNTKTE